jgi:short-subunit dehydrogenase
MSSFKEKVILVTGGASGIGFLMGKKSLQKGAKHLIICDINPQLLEEAKSSLTKDGFSVSTQLVDVSDPVKVDDAANEILNEYEKVDILFNNAGIIVGKPFQEHSSLDISRTVGVNQLALMYVTNAFLPTMMKSNSGHIIAITSSAGLTPNPGMVVYVSSKWGAVGWVESLRIELKKSHPGIKFTNVMPGYIKSKMFDGVTPPRMMPLLDPEKLTDKIIESVQQNRTTLKAPALVKITTLARGLLPQSWYDFVAANIFRVYTSMDTFKGHGNE